MLQLLRALHTLATTSQTTITIVQTTAIVAVRSRLAGTLSQSKRATNSGLSSRSVSSSQITGTANARSSAAFTPTSGQVQRPARYLAISTPMLTTSTAIRNGNQKLHSAGSKI